MGYVTVLGRARLPRTRTHPRGECRADQGTRHRLGGPSTVQTSLNALVREEVLAREGPRYVVVDSLFREWVARHTF
jgi:hypothetical protein